MGDRLHQSGQRGSGERGAARDSRLTTLKRRSAQYNESSI
jgi:hypothetical protein